MAEHMGSNKNTAIAFLEMAANGRAAEAFQRFVSPTFRHHSPNVKGDAASLLAAMAKRHEDYPEHVFEVKHALEDRDFVAVHSRVRLEPGGDDMSCVQLFRFVAIRIVELWDITQAVPKGAVNTHGMF
jgi:predicted SnoaL-like aldol condensation-catalyzing enzyme